MKSCEMSLVKLNSFSALDEKKKRKVFVRKRGKESTENNKHEQRHQNRK